MTVAKTIEISAESPTSFAEAAKVGIAKAAETVHGIEGAYIKEQKVIVTDGRFWLPLISIGMSSAS